jgi:cytochrome P450
MERLTPRETTAVVADVLAPLVARGLIVRRPRVVGALDRLDADRRAVRRLQRLEEEHGPGPVLLALAGRDVALVLDPGDVRRVLRDSPEPFTPASREKRAALAHFQPHGVLISRGDVRAERRRFNEAVLEFGRPVHHLSRAFRPKVAEEVAAMVAGAHRGAALTWDAFAVPWWRLVRRVVFGERARDDHELTDRLRRLRADANWAFLKPRRTGLRDEFVRGVRHHLARAEPGSLAHQTAATPAPPGTEPDQQVPQWLFAFDAAGMAAFRALALIASHGEQERRDGSFLRAGVLESVRLWPTTPAILRDTTTETSWATGTLPAGAAVAIFAPYFHRDGRRLPFADRFAPEVWLDGEDPADWPLVPFSAGPAECPGRDLVLFLTSAVLAGLLESAQLRPQGPAALDPAAPLPATLSPFRLRFAVAG